MSDAINAGVTMFCGQCGHKNAPNFNFCQSCGTMAPELAIGNEATDTPEVPPQSSMTLLKACGYFAAAIGIHIVWIKIWPDATVLLPYFVSGFVMSRIVMRGLIEWHPTYNTLENVVSDKLKMFALWPLQMPMLLLKLMFNKVL